LTRSFISFITWDTDETTLRRLVVGSQNLKNQTFAGLRIEFSVPPWRDDFIR